MLIKKILLSVSACVLFSAAGATHAYDCSNLPQFAVGPIATGAKVKNNNTAFQCIEGGWCSQGGPYEPGVGWAQQYAWNNLGACGTTTSSVASSVASSVVASVKSSVATTTSSSKSSVVTTSSTSGCSGYVTYDNNAVYVKDNVVVYNGQIWRAKWWTQYEAPSSTGGSGVWELIGPCGGSSAKSSTPSSVASSVASSVKSSVGSSMPNTGLKIVGYTPSWSTVESTIQYSKLTHINYAFVLPNGNGSLQETPSKDLLRSIVSHGHANGVKVVVSIGGWNDGNDSAFVSLASAKASRDLFVSSVLSLIGEFNLDGIDIDWEYPDPDTAESSNYSLLMSALADAMHSRGKILTAAVVGDGYTGNGVKPEVFGYVDFLNLMAYDQNNGDHSSFQYANDSINFWSNRGLPASKLVLGVPYYAHPSWSAYNTLVGQNSANACRDTNGSDYWNGIPTIRKKAQLARSYGGIMTWELSQDTSGSNSLLNAMWEIITGRTGSYPCN